MFKNYPFIRLIVYNGVSQPTYVAWELHNQMRDKSPYRFQLQVNRTANPDDPGWRNIGYQQEDPPFLLDGETLVYGYVLDKYYRVILTTGDGVYTSLPFGCTGQLRPREWKLAREVLRKEKLRFKYTAVPVTILKRKRYGEVCTECGDGNTSQNSQCLQCYGTGIQGGYHAAFRMQVMDISPSRLMERHYSGSAATWGFSVDRYQARALGVPELHADDILVDESTGQRFRVTASPVLAQMHRVPLVRQLDMLLLPFSDVAYQLPSSSEALSEASHRGCGVHVVSPQHYEDLVYETNEGYPIPGATVKIFHDSELIGETYTTLDGGWESVFHLDPGKYTIIYEKIPDYGPDTFEFTLNITDLSEEERKILEKAEEKDSKDYLNPFRLK